MKSNTETLIDDSGIELLVEYDYEKGDPQFEECHGTHDVGGMVYTELKSVELVIAGRGIQLIHVLHPNEKEFIISKLQYEAA